MNPGMKLPKLLLVLAALSRSMSAASVTPVLSILNPTIPAGVSYPIDIYVNSKYSPTGTVTLMEGPTVVGQATTSNADIYNVFVTYPTAGAHTLIASYSGDANLLPAQSPSAVIQVVATSVVLSASGPTGLAFGIHASVSGAGLCLGSVSLAEGPTVLGTAVLTAGAADFASPPLPGGQHTLVGAYLPVSEPACGPAASAPFPVYIGFPASSTRIASITPNPSLFGQLPIATVQVAAAVGTATGQVVLKQGSTTLGVGNLDSSGSVVFNLPSLPV